MVGGSEKMPKTKKEKKKEPEFEFCKVCKLNHNQGRSHKYFPNHVKALSTFLSRFLEKLSDVRFFIKNPTFLRPEHASRNRLWCVFCDSDIEELDSQFPCGNAIKHLASAKHLNNLRDFLWKHGGGMGRVDSFRVSENEFTKWEKRCMMLKDMAATSNGRLYEPSLGPLKDIHIELSSDNRDSFDQNTSQSFKSNVSNGFLPLQDFTHESHQVSHPQGHKVANICHIRQQAAFLDVGMPVLGNTTRDLKGYRDGQHVLVDTSRNSSLHWVPCSETVGRQVTGESSNQVLQSITQISSLPAEESIGNVHSGAPPPWFETNGENLLNFHLDTDLHAKVIASSLKKSEKSHKLNPKRVGAAWAEKRKIELEMEKRGEIIPKSFDADWLPNFGGVWQSGSRKESRKEFQMEEARSVNIGNISDVPIKLVPYVSKRMRRNADESKVVDVPFDDVS